MPVTLITHKPTWHDNNKRQQWTQHNTHESQVLRTTVTASLMLFQNAYSSDTEWIYCPPALPLPIYHVWLISVSSQVYQKFTRKCLKITGTEFLQCGWSSQHLTNSVKALKNYCMLRGNTTARKYSDQEWTNNQFDEWHVSLPLK